MNVALTALLLLVLMAIDLRQTLRITANPTLWYETNPLLGKHPSARRVVVWFALCALALVPLWLYAPHDVATGVLLVCSVLELYCVTNNRSLGL